MWWIGIAAGALAVMLVVDWLIIMGVDPRKWKGGGKEK